MSRYEKVTIEGFSFQVDPTATKILTNAEIDRVNDMQNAIAGLTGEHADYINPPEGGSAVDIEARAVINAIIAALITSGIINPEE